MCDLVLVRWADAPPDNAPKKVPEAFQGAVRWGGGGGEVRGRAKYTSDPSSHAAHQPHASQPTNQMEQSGEQPRKAKRSIDRPQGRPFIVCHDKQQAASSAGPQPKSTSTTTSESRSRSRSKRVVAGNQSPITEGRGGEMDQQVRASGS